MKKILEPGLNCDGIYDVDDTGLLIDACDYYRAFYHAARNARRYILIAGWQFDSEVRLLRGKEAEEADEDVRFLQFLEGLCAGSPELEISILAWDFTVVFSMEREWFQDWIFNWSSNKRIRFRFDSTHAVGATHHQKLVVIDGAIAFVGGIDICSDRWDDRRHQQENPDRANTDGKVYGPYHDIQTYHTGAVVRELTELFEQRWLNSGGSALLLPPPMGKRFTIKPSIPLAAEQVALSRTQARTFQPLQEPVQEIRRLFVDAITAAEQMIYIENQYFSSQAVYWALVNRMLDSDRSRLQIVLLLPARLPPTEKLFIGTPQMRMIHSLQKIAAQAGHDMGVYSTFCLKEGERKMIFIHSKVLLVDDRFLTVGSANTNNRSMGLDTELNVVWEAETTNQKKLIKSIQAVRTSLLAEHIGVLDRNKRRRLEKVKNLVKHLDLLADDPSTRLCRYELDPPVDNILYDALEPVARIIDPEKPIVEEYPFEDMADQETGLFSRKIRLLSQWFSDDKSGSV